MQKRAPTLGNMIVIILFVLSCFGLLLFLWESFGGPLPLKPKGYRMTVSFPASLALAEQSEVRVSGVNVGRVVALNSSKVGRTKAELEINKKYAPVRANMHAILRQKTLLGETYVQLIPQNGGHSGPFLKDNGELRLRTGRTVGHARRDPLGVRSEDATRLPDLAAVGRRRDQRARRTDQCRVLLTRTRSWNTPTRWWACSTPRRGPCGRWSRTRAWCSTRWPAATISSKG